MKNQKDDVTTKGFFKKVTSNLKGGASTTKIYSVIFLLLLVVAGVIYLQRGATKADGITSAPKAVSKNLENVTAEILGQALFFDTNLSKRRTMSCATCHDPAVGFVDARKTVANGMSSLGNNKKSFGDRNAPTAAYASFSPKFYYSEKKNAYIGGQFLDGRAATLAAQAGGPPLNPIEMEMPNKESVVERLKENDFYVLAFKKLYGEEIWNDAEKAYEAMTLAIEAFEKTEFFSPFDSKYDRFLRGEYELTLLEDLGRSLFFSSTNVNCSTCHKLKFEDAEQEVFTNHEYHNIGVPKNKKLIANSKLPENFIDNGLFKNPMVKSEKEKGKFRVPTLRNIAVTGPYMHNGVFKDLRTVILFYDKYNNPKRGINPETKKPWAAPEVAENIAFDKLAAKEFTDRKVDALIAFLRLLTDKRYEHLLETTE